MFKDRHDNVVVLGDYLMDTTGIYQVLWISRDVAEMQEFFIDDEGNPDSPGDTCLWTPTDFRKAVII